MERPYPLLVNPFRSAMEDSFIKASTLSAYTAAALLAQAPTDPAIAAIEAYYRAINAGIQTAFAAWRAQTGAQKGDTQTLNDLLRSMRDEVDDWMFMAEQVHREGSSRFLQLFPNGKGPFTTGPQASRINAVSALAVEIGSEPELADLLGRVQDFELQLKDANAAQKGSKSTTESLSETLEAAIRAGAVGMYSSYGGLIRIFPTEPERMEVFFNVALMREKEQRAFTGTVAISATKNIARRTLEPSAQIRIVNSGDAPLKFYFAPEKNDAAPATGGVPVAPGEDETVTVSALGTGPFLKVFNESTEGAGAFELVIL